MKEKKRDTQTLIIVGLIAVILCMSIGFAVYARTLNINGTVNVKGSQWSVHYVANSYNEKDYSVEADNVSLNSTTLTYSVDLPQPGDTYEFYIDVINDGTLRAQLDSVVTTQLTQEQAQYMSIEMTYNPDKNSSTYEDFGNGNKVLTNPIVLDPNKQARLNVKIQYKYDVEADVLPEEDATINFATTLNYSQSA